jgi:yeast amino acid transporter
MNTVIVFAILSAGNSCIYGASRSLAALATQKQAPAFLAYIDRSGTPVAAILFSSAFGLLAYFEVADPPTASIVIVWMVAICGQATTFSWMSICLCHIRFRRAWRVQGHNLEEIPRKSRASLVGSWIGFALSLAVLILRLVNTRHWLAVQYAKFFFEEFLIIPVIAVMYLVYKFWKGTRIQRASTMHIKVEWQEHLTREVPKQEAEDGILPDHCY